MGSGANICVGVIAFILMSSIPIAMIVLGAVHYDDCPMQPWIPKFMIVSGGATLALILSCLCAFNAAKGKSGASATIMLVFIVLLGLFLFAWQIAGSVWVFKEWKDWNSLDKEYQEVKCHRDTYLFVFALLIIFWITCPCQGGGSAKAKDMS